MTSCPETLYIDLGNNKYTPSLKAESYRLNQPYDIIINNCQKYIIRLFKGDNQYVNIDQVGQLVLGFLTGLAIIALVSQSK